MNKMISMKQKAKIILNSKDAIKTTVSKTISTVATNVITNYKFNVNLSVPLSNNSRIVASSFIFNHNNATLSAKEVGGVYCKSLTPYNTFNSEGYYKGTHLLSTILDGVPILYENQNIEMNSMPLHADNGAWLNNGIDIFVDSKKLDDTLVDIGGCIDADSWVLTLIIYDVEEYKTISTELSSKIKDFVFPVS